MKRSGDARMKKEGLETIIAEFPNTQMAAEVRSMIEVLRTRAGPAGKIGTVTDFPSE